MQIFTSNRARWTLALAALLASTAALADQRLDQYTGTWAINYEESDKLIVEYKDGAGLSGSNLKPSISVMGLPLPSSIQQGPMSSLRPKDPEILRCTNVAISHDGAKISMRFDGTASETIRLGDYRGRTTKVSKSKVEQKYKTTERTVSKAYSIREDERLLVVVKIKFKGDKRRTFSRVFDRISTDPTAVIETTERG